MQSLSAEKLSLARKVYAYVEANLGKIAGKMSAMEAEGEGLQGYQQGKKDDKK
jgi:hypothetical protein